MYFPQFTPPLFNVSFLSPVKMNSINWSAPNVWLFIAQLVEYCSLNLEPMRSNLVVSPKFFIGLFCNCLNWYNNYDDHVLIYI